MKQKKQIFKKNKEFNLVVDFFGGLTNTAKVPQFFLVRL
jgi:hypothetical protein